MVSSTRASFGRRALWSGYWRLVVWMYPWGIILQKAFVPGILFHTIYYFTPVTDKSLCIKKSGHSDFNDLYLKLMNGLNLLELKKKYDGGHFFIPDNHSLISTANPAPLEWNWDEKNLKKGHFYVKTMSARIPW